MDIQRIKAAVKAGLTVHWCNEGYTVETDKHDQWFITWRKGQPGENSVGLIDNMAHKPENFFVPWDCMDFCMDDSMHSEKASPDSFGGSFQHRYVRIETGDGRKWWVAVHSYLPDVLPDQSEAADLALDMIMEKFRMIPAGQAQGTVEVRVI